jgi:hypothetical protein
MPVKTQSRLSRYALPCLLLASHTVFLWMFFCGESVERTAVSGFVKGYPGDNLTRAAELFAARWRHGMAGNSPLYMPGFFAVGVITWLWSMQRSVRGMVREDSVLIALATVLGAFLAPLGTPAAIRGFERATGATCLGIAGGFTAGSASEALYTLLTWSAGVVCLRIAVSRRSFAPLALPLILNVILLIMRPWAVNGYTSQWIQDLSRGMPEAVLSVFAAPVLVTLLIMHQLRSEHRSLAQDS